MFDNIGNKIKTLAVVIAVIEAFCGIIFGFALILKEDSYVFERLIGILTIIISPILSWVGCFLMYGFGELVQNSTEIRSMMENREMREANDLEEMLREKIEDQEECGEFYDPEKS